MGGSNSIDKEKAFRDLLPTTTIKDTLLAGHTWKVAQTTLPLWLKGDKLSPRLTYTQDSQSPERIHDLVQYINEKGKSESIHGGDTWPEGSECPAYLLWRGTGALALITSEWYVLHVSEKTISKESTVPKFVIIYFLSTMFTPEGMDVLTPVVEGVPVDEEALSAEVEAAKAKFTMLSDVFDALKPTPNPPAEALM